MTRQVFQDSHSVGAEFGSQPIDLKAFLPENGWFGGPDDIPDPDPAQVKEEPDPIPFFTLEEIYNTPVELNPVINGMFDEGEGVVIYSPGGVGKSLLTHYMAMCMASGIHDNIWGFDIPKPRISCFIQSENSRARAHFQTVKMVGGDSDLAGGLSNIFFPNISDGIQISGYFSDEKFKAYLYYLIDKIEEKTEDKLDLLFVDPLISFHEADENDNSRMRSTLDALTEICQARKVTPVVIHHASKKDKDDKFHIRGASSISDWARCVIRVEDKLINGENHIEITHEKSNNHLKFNPFLIRFNDFLIPEYVTKKQAYGEKQAEKYDNILEALESLGGESSDQKAILKAYQEISGKPLSTGRRHLKEAVTEGIISCEHYGKVGNIDKSIYRIIDNYDN